MRELTNLIIQWAYDRGLQTMDPTKQMLKLTEEVGELAGSLAKKRMTDSIDAIGDIYVVLTILSLQLDLNIEECVKAAYDVIKNRKGKVVDGVFIKEE